MVGFEGFERLLQPLGGAGGVDAQVEVRGAVGRLVAPLGHRQPQEVEQRPAPVRARLVARHGEQEARQVAARAQRARRAGEGHPGVLRQVVGGHRVAAQPQQEPVDPAGVAGIGLVKGRPVSLL